ncbi:GGDEF domain-containing protein [Vibrio chagasii]|uniref:GGDEF domain-containing protein n=1 Tax=Vibrio chagasii TaxID=170679 RepID=UPI003736825C
MKYKVLFICLILSSLTYYSIFNYSKFEVKNTIKESIDNVKTQEKHIEEKVDGVLALFDGVDQIKDINSFRKLVNIIEFIGFKVTRVTNEDLELYTNGDTYINGFASASASASAIIYSDISFVKIIKGFKLTLSVPAYHFMDRELLHKQNTSQYFVSLPEEVSNVSRSDIRNLLKLDGQTHYVLYEELLEDLYLSRLLYVESVEKPKLQFIYKPDSNRDYALISILFAVIFNAYLLLSVVLISVIKKLTNKSKVNQSILKNLEYVLVDNQGNIINSSDSFNSNFGKLSNLSEATTEREFQALMNTNSESSRVDIEPAHKRAQRIKISNFHFCYFTDIKDIAMKLDNVVEEAKKDPMTGALNRSALPMINECINELSSLKMNYSVVMLDIDHFKRINDTFGHSVGDKAIRYVVDTVQSMIRPDDILIRWGGEEFLIYLSDVDFKTTELICERIRKKFEENTSEHRFTISLGAINTKQETDTERLINMADSNLYRSKQSGRNQLFLEVA